MRVEYTPGSRTDIIYEFVPLVGLTGKIKEVFFV